MLPHSIGPARFTCLVVSDSAIPDHHRVRAVCLFALLPLTVCLTGCAGGSRGAAHVAGDTDPCADFDVTVERFWSSTIRAEVMGRGGEIELELRTGAANDMDRISEDWVMTRTSTCKDHFVRGLISRDEYAARVRCFDDRLDRLRTLSEALRAPPSSGDDPSSVLQTHAEALLAQPPSCEPHS